MRTVYKYPIQITDEQKLSVHHGSVTKLMHVGLDPVGVPCVWAEVDSEAQLAPVFTLYIIGTGGPVPERATRYIGSFVQKMFVWHVYV